MILRIGTQLDAHGFDPSHALAVAQHYLGQVPNTVWSGLVAAGLTLLGVMISNSQNTRRLIIQIRHDADQKQKDRMASLHKQVYMEFCAEASKAMAFLAQLPQIDTNNPKEMNGLIPFHEANAKLQVVAKEETMVLANILAQLLSKAYIELLVSAAPIHQRNTDRKIIEGQINKWNDQADRILNDIRALNPSTPSDAARISALSVEYRNTDGLINDGISKINNLQSGFADRLSDFNKKLFECTNPISELIITLNSSIRSEIGLSTDVAMLKDELEKARSLAWSSVNEAFSHFDKK